MVIAPAVYSLAYSSVRPGAPGYMFWWVPPSLLDGQYTVTLSDYYSHAVVATSPVFNISVRPETRDPFPPPTQLSQSGSKDISLPAVPPHQGLNPSDFPSIFFVDLLPQPNGQPYGAQIWFDSLTPGANQTAFFDYAELPDFKSTGNGDYYKSIHSGQVSAMSTYGRYYFVLLPDGPPSQVSIASSARVTLKIALPCPDCDMTHGICQAGVCQCFPGMFLFLLKFLTRLKGILAVTAAPKFPHGVEILRKFPLLSFLELEEHALKSRIILGRSVTIHASLEM